MASVDFASGGYINPPNTTTFTTAGTTQEATKVAYLDAYETAEDKRVASLRVLDDVLNNRTFSKRAYDALDVTGAIVYILSELVNKEEK